MKTNHLKIGSEIKIKTSDGSIFEGIYMDIQEKYLTMVASLGIILTIPMHSIIQVSKTI